jgi:hypothetical protein
MVVAVGQVLAAIWVAAAAVSLVLGGQAILVGLLLVENLGEYLCQLPPLAEQQLLIGLVPVVAVAG